MHVTQALVNTVVYSTEGGSNRTGEPQGSPAGRAASMSEEALAIAPKKANGDTEEALLRAISACLSGRAARARD